MIFDPKELELLSGILAKKIEDWPSLLKRSLECNLSRAEADHICDSLLAEFMSKGINETYEPNEYGLQIEMLIDKVNKSITPQA